MQQKRTTLTFFAATAGPAADSAARTVHRAPPAPTSQPGPPGLFFAAMYTYRRLRHATRWNRRFAFALVILLLLALSWSAYRAWQRAQPHKTEQRGQLAYR